MKKIHESFLELSYRSFWQMLSHLSMMCCGKGCTEMCSLGGKTFPQQQSQSLGFLNPPAVIKMCQLNDLDVKNKFTVVVIRLSYLSHCRGCNADTSDTADTSTASWYKCKLFASCCTGHIDILPSRRFRGQEVGEELPTYYINFPLIPWDQTR